MKWTFKLNRRLVKWKIVEDVVAVPPPLEHHKANGNHQFKEPGGDSKHGSDSELPTRDLQIFKRAGWNFIAPPFPIDSRLPAAGSEIREIYITERGDMLISTNLVTVQLTGSLMPLEKAKEVLAQDQLSIAHKLGFAPNLYAVRITSQQSLPEAIDKLQQRTDRYVFAEPSLYQVITGRLMPTDPQFGNQWQHAAEPSFDGTGGFGLNSIDAWNITKGVGSNRPARIAVIDNGMNIAHPDLVAGIKGGGFFRPDWPGSGTATFIRFQPGMLGFPVKGHGTFCMGMAGARINNTNGGCGVAPEADLMALACASDQTGTQLTLARTIECAVNPTSFDPLAEPKGGTDVISCSLKTAGILESCLEMAITSAAAEGRYGLGVPIFWAVDNYATDISDDLVCSLPDVIAVGRSNRNGDPDGSATGPKLAFLAPGAQVFGPAQSTNNIFQTGTSFATPLAAGVAALVLSRHPDWTAAQVLEHMRATCDEVEAPEVERGSGRLNAYSAVL